MGHGSIENLVATCRKCHEDASTSFPNAWLGHYEPSPTQAAPVYYTELFFVTLTVSVIFALEGHVVMDFVRVLRDRYFASSIKENAVDRRLRGSSPQFARPFSLLKERYLASRHAEDENTDEA